MEVYCETSSRNLLRNGSALVSGELMQVLIPSPLRSYTQNLSQVESSGTTLAELLDNLDKSYPGIKFRMIDEQEAIRQHIRIYVDRQPALALDLNLKDAEIIQIICALSGG